MHLDLPKRVAVVGAGPAGFYASEELLKAGLEADLYDTLPTPFGLVRAGVAPDHPKIKAVTRVYERTARRNGFRFFGGVELGTDIQRADLLERYHAVVYAIGTPADRRLAIAGEDVPGSHAATEFVAWYNGHPAFADHRFDLSTRCAVVIGNGNVAIDVARMLVLNPNELAKTDAADHAIEALSRAQIARVIIIGRRGPAQASFTNPELLELGNLEGCDVLIDPAEVALDGPSARWLETDGDKTARRNVEILTEYSQRRVTGNPRCIELRFLRSPLEMQSNEGGTRVTGLQVMHNRIEPAAKGELRPVPTGEQERIPCGLVLRAVGYLGRPLPGLPFDERRGVLRHDRGRVVGEDGSPLPGEYGVGWIKRGASGVIGTNKKDAAETMARLVEDAHLGALNHPAKPQGEAVEPWLRSRVDGLVTWAGWEAIDRHEVRLGRPSARPRRKLVRVSEMLSLAGRNGVRR